MPDIHAWNVYVNFVLLAVTGRMAEADAMMRQHGGAVRSMARWLRTGARGWGGAGYVFAEAADKVIGAPLWRGLLLEPEVLVPAPKRGTRLPSVTPDPNLTFLSFSMDRDVACWFADPESVISGAVAQMRPRSEGWIARYDKARPRSVLWIHSWDAVPVPDGSGRVLPLAVAAARYPGLAADQFAWNLRTQSEVILDARDVGPLYLERRGDDCPATAELDDRLTPPSVARNPDEQLDLPFFSPGGEGQAEGSARPVRDRQPDTDGETELETATPLPPRFDLTPRGIREYRVTYNGAKRRAGALRHYFLIHPLEVWGERNYGFGEGDDWSWRDRPVGTGEDAVIRIDAATEQRLIHQARKRGREPR